MRLDNNGEKLKDMAAAFEIPSSYLSAIENGRKPIPDNFPVNVYEHFGSTGPSLRDWEELAAESRNCLKIDLRGADALERDIYRAMGRRFNQLSEEKKHRILELLKSDE